jgi:hypothetical protein
VLCQLARLERVLWRPLKEVFYPGAVRGLLRASTRTLVRQSRAHGAANEGQAGERGDVPNHDGGLTPWEDEGIGGPRPERRELEQQGLAPAHPIRRREDGPQDPELPPQVLVPRLKLCDPLLPEP